MDSCVLEGDCDTVPGSNLNDAYCMPLKIGVAPHDANDASAVSAATNFMSWIANMTDLYPEVNERETFMYFSSESAMLDYIRQPTYSLDVQNVTSLSSGIIFQQGYPQWEYTLRFNRSIAFNTGTRDYPPTFADPVDIVVKNNAQIPLIQDFVLAFTYVDTYVAMGYYTLANVVNSYVASETCRMTDGCSAADVQAVEARGAVDFPNKRVLQDGFWGTLGSTFALLMIVALLYPLANIIKSLVAEKESKMREGMLMMALRGEALWISWLIHFYMLFIPLSVIMTFASMPLLEYSSMEYVFLYYLLFFTASTSFCILISTMFSKARTASIIGNFLFFAGYFIFVGLDGTKQSRGAYMVACLHPATAFTYGTLAFQEYEDAQIGITSHTWNTSSEYSITFRDTLVMLIVDTFYMGALAWYFEQVWPNEFGTTKPWYFPFLPSYWYSMFGFTSTMQEQDGMDECQWLFRGLSQWCWSFWSASIGWFCGHSSFQKVNSQDIASRDIELPSVEEDRASDASDAVVEEVGEVFHQQRMKGQCVHISHLSKTFQTPTGRKTAVNNLSLDMYAGQITSLLGHNGAGKVRHCP